MLLDLFNVVFVPMLITWIALRSEAIKSRFPKWARNKYKLYFFFFIIFYVTYWITGIIIS